MRTKRVLATFFFRSCVCVRGSVKTCVCVCVCDDRLRSGGARTCAPPGDAAFHLRG